MTPARCRHLIRSRWHRFLWKHMRSDERFMRRVLSARALGLQTRSDVALLVALMRGIDQRWETLHRGGPR